MIASLAIGGLLALAALAFLFLQLRPWMALAALKRKIRRQFPKVPQIAPEDLARRLDAGERIVLVDVRRADEHAVSHLRGARRLDAGEKAPTLPGVDPGAQVVAYCSVGWRSSQMAERLRAAGYANAANLEGSIFDWARLGLPLVQGERPVRRVHPYGKPFAFLVPKDQRAWTPEEAREDAV